MDADVAISDISPSKIILSPSSQAESTQGLTTSNSFSRPQCFNDYPGQETVKENLKIFIEAAKRRNNVMDHTMLHGPPGLGKTTLAHIIANEFGCAFVSSSGPALERQGDLAGILAGFKEGTIFFIDEIHRLSLQVEEVLYSAMEDFTLDVIVGQGAAARSMTIPIVPFTLIGATTRLSSLSRPFLSRFGIQEHLSFYNNESLVAVLARSAQHASITLEPSAAHMLASRARGTPRIANRLLRRVWDFAEVCGDGVINDEIVALALSKLDIDCAGLDRCDRNILQTIADTYKGGPVGIDTLAASLGEERATLEEVYEPYLVHAGFILRTARGRVITESGKQMLKK